MVFVSKNKNKKKKVSIGIKFSKNNTTKTNTLLVLAVVSLERWLIKDLKAKTVFNCWPEMIEFCIFLEKSIRIYNVVDMYWLHSSSSDFPYVLGFLFLV